MKPNFWMRFALFSSKYYVQNFVNSQISCLNDGYYYIVFLFIPLRTGNFFQKNQYLSLILNWNHSSLTSFTLNFHIASINKNVSNSIDLHIITCGLPANLFANCKKFCSFCWDRCALSRNFWHVSSCVRHMWHTTGGNPSFGDI